MGLGWSCHLHASQDPRGGPCFHSEAWLPYSGVRDGISMLAAQTGGLREEKGLFPVIL